MRKLALHVAVAISLAFVFVAALNGASPAQQQGNPNVITGKLPECVSPQQAIADDRKLVTSKEWVGSQVFTAREVQLLKASARREGADVDDIDTVAVVWLKFQKPSGEYEELAGIYYGHGGKVCDWAILPAVTARRYFEDVLGRRA